MIVIPQHVVEAIIAHAREDAPNECCGLLVGRAGRVDEAVRTTNIRQSTTAFQVDPAEHVAARRRARAEGRDIVGAYHSHPRSAARPSPRDVAEAHYPEFVYVIVSLAGDPPDVRAYSMKAGAIEELTMER